MISLNAQTWISLVMGVVTVAAAVFCWGVAWSRGKLEGQVGSLERFISEWRREDQASRAEFRASVERRMDRIDERLDDKQDKD